MGKASVCVMQINRLSDFLGSVIVEVLTDVFDQQPGQRLNPIGWNCFYLLRLWAFDLNWVWRSATRAGCLASMHDPSYREAVA